METLEKQQLPKNPAIDGYPQ